MTEKQKRVVDFWSEIYYEKKKHCSGKEKFAEQIEENYKKISDLDKLANLSEEERSKLLESAKLLRKESTDSIGVVEAIGALFLSFIAMLASSINITVASTQLYDGFTKSVNIACIAISVLAFILVVHTGYRMYKNAKRADQYRNVILALLLPKDDEAQNKANETKTCENGVNGIKQGEIETAKVKQNESK